MLTVAVRVTRATVRVIVSWGMVTWIVLEVVIVAVAVAVAVVVAAVVVLIVLMLVVVLVAVLMLVVVTVREMVREVVERMVVEFVSVSVNVDVDVMGVGVLVMVKVVGMVVMMVVGIVVMMVDGTVVVMVVGMRVGDMTVDVRTKREVTVDVTADVEVAAVVLFVHRGTDANAVPLSAGAVPAVLVTVTVSNSVVAAMVTVAGEAPPWDDGNGGELAATQKDWFTGSVSHGIATDGF